MKAQRKVSLSAYSFVCQRPIHMHITGPLLLKITLGWRKTLTLVTLRGKPALDNKRSAFTNLGLFFYVFDFLTPNGQNDR